MQDARGNEIIPRVVCRRPTFTVGCLFAYDLHTLQNTSLLKSPSMLLTPTRDPGIPQTLCLPDRRVVCNNGSSTCVPKERRSNHPDMR